jgi:hypothetical protein
MIGGGGGTRSRFTKCGGFFGPLAWRLQALLCGRCWAGPCVFGVHWVLWGFRSVDVLDVVFCSINMKLHCWCGTKPHQQCNFISTNTNIEWCGVDPKEIDQNN